MKTNRIFLTVKDLCVLTGNKYRSCWREFQIMKSSLGKKKEQKITFEEYAGYEGVNVDEVRKALGLIN